MGTDENRRPLKVRAAKLPTKIAKFLSRKNISPNQISVLSIFFALGAATCLISIQTTQLNSTLLCIAAAVMIQGRLLCNLFDGMVAIEGGKKTLSGELFNDIPDRIADPLILISLGYASNLLPYNSTLGWSAALLAVLTAYIRTLACSAGAPANFGGPMAKQHRMAITTFACLITPLETFFAQSGTIFTTTLFLINIGCVITIILRTRSAYKALEGK